MFEFGRIAFDAFALFVAPAKQDRVLMPWIGLERGNLIRGHQPALELEAEQGGRAESVKIARFNRAQIAFGFDMQADGSANPYREVFLQELLADHLMAHIHALFGNRLAAIMQEMSDIMQKRGNDQRAPRSVLSCGLCALQGVGSFGHGLTIHSVSAIIENRLDAGNTIVGQSIFVLLLTGEFEIRSGQRGSRFT